MRIDSLNPEHNVPLCNCTTFRIGGPARYFVRARTCDELVEAIRVADTNHVPLFVLGGGSNVLVSDAGFQGLVVKVETRGVAIRCDDPDYVEIDVAAGEDWDTFVELCVDSGYWGVENMTLIPGSVGALPIQNVGAYGQDANQVVVGVEAWDRKDEIRRTLSREACRFGYRRSIFNGDNRGRYVILSVTVRLLKNSRANFSHESVEQQLSSVTPRWTDRLKRQLGVASPSQRTAMETRGNSSLRDMRRCIQSLRSDGRLPDLESTGNAGSFFRSAAIPSLRIRQLVKRVESVFGKDAADRVETFCRLYSDGDLAKIPVAFLIEACGLKSMRFGGAALYDRNPSIVINPMFTATAADVLNLTKHVRQSLFRQTGVLLDTEPEFVGFTSKEIGDCFSLSASGT